MYLKALYKQRYLVFTAFLKLIYKQRFDFSAFKGNCISKIYSRHCMNKGLFFTAFKLDINKA